MSRHPRKLSDDQIELIRTSDDSVTEDSVKHGVNRGVISNVRRGKTYKLNAEGLSYSGWPDGRIGVGCQPLLKSKRK